MINIVAIEVQEGTATAISVVRKFKGLSGSCAPVCTHPDPFRQCLENDHVHGKLRRNNFQEVLPILWVSCSEKGLSNCLS